MIFASTVIIRFNQISCEFASLKSGDVRFFRFSAPSWKLKNLKLKLRWIRSLEPISASKLLCATKHVFLITNIWAKTNFFPGASHFLFFGSSTGLEKERFPSRKMFFFTQATGAGDVKSSARFHDSKRRFQIRMGEEMIADNVRHLSLSSRLQLIISFQWRCRERVVQQVVSPSIFSLLAIPTWRARTDALVCVRLFLSD